VDAHLEEFLARFRRRATAAFLDAYRKVLQASAHPWIAPAALDAAILLFLVEKACYEVRYEAANRPTWLLVPVQGLLRLLQGSDTEAGDG